MKHDHGERDMTKDDGIEMTGVYPLNIQGVDNQSYKTNDDENNQTGVDAHNAMSSPSFDDNNNGSLNYPNIKEDVDAESGNLSVQVRPEAVDEYDEGDHPPTHEKLEFEEPNPFISFIISSQKSLDNFMTKYKNTLSTILIIALALAYILYFINAMVYSELKNEGDIRLLWITCLLAFSMTLSRILDLPSVNLYIKKLGKALSPHEENISWTNFGYEAFKWLGDRFTEFLSFTDYGSKFVFGDLYKNHYFAFKVIPVIIFFSTVTSMLYYLGAMQVVIKKVAFVMQVAMATTAGESLNAAGNIFLGQTEAPLLIKPLVQHMTESELHSIMTTGFATIAGSVLATYILFGVPASHLISASVMSAPAALAISKLFYPETCKSITTTKELKTMKEEKPYRNIIDAASSGASASISLIANIIVNLIAFLALLNFMDAVLQWFGDRIGVDGLSFELCASYILFPVVWVMGVETQDCRQIASLIGVKTFLNEFVAYDKLGKVIKNSNNLANMTLYHTVINSTTDGFNEIVFFDGLSNSIVYINGVISKRSEIIATYALCGFANFGSIGVMLGGLKSMAPNQRKPLAKVVMRAMIAGNVACFMTACIAGLFYQEQ